MTDDKEAFERGYWDGRQAIKRMIPLENIFPWLNDRGLICVKIIKEDKAEG
jgi:hypothetical protein